MSRRSTRSLEIFAENYVAGGCTNASEAYRKTFNCEDWNPESVWAEACRMLKHHKVVTRLAELKEAATSKAVCSMEEHLAELERLKTKAVEAGQISAAVKAEELRGKVLAFYVQRTQDMTPQPDLTKVIEALTPDNPQLRAALLALVPDETGVDLLN